MTPRLWVLVPPGPLSSKITLSELFTLGMPSTSETVALCIYCYYTWLELLWFCFEFAEMLAKQHDSDSPRPIRDIGILRMDIGLT